MSHDLRRLRLESLLERIAKGQHGRTGDCFLLPGTHFGFNLVLAG